MTAETYTPEGILSITAEEVVQRLEQDDRFAEYVQSLIVEVYRDDTLADIREALMEEAVKHDSVNCPWRQEWGKAERKKHRQETYPLAYGIRNRTLINIRVRALARARCAIKGRFDVTVGADTDPRTRDELTSLINRTRDGDLAFRYRGIGDIFNMGLTFSPEFERRKEEAK